MGDAVVLPAQREGVGGRREEVLGGEGGMEIDRRWRAGREVGHGVSWWARERRATPTPTITTTSMHPRRVRCGGRLEEGMCRRCCVLEWGLGGGDLHREVMNHPQHRVGNVRHCPPSMLRFGRPKCRLQEIEVCLSS